MLHSQVKDWSLGAWHAAVILSARHRVIDGVEMPGLPPDDVQIQVVGSAGEHNLREAAKFMLALKVRSEQLGAPISASSRVLDFGCGWGRMTRFLAREVPDDRLFGADPSPDMIELCRESGAVGTFVEFDRQGALPFDDGFFTHIYAYSVFTHLPLKQAQYWLSELARVSAPGAVLCLTVEPLRFLDFIAQPPPEPANAWHKSLHDQFGRFMQAVRPRAEAAGHVFLPTNGRDVQEFYGDAVYTEAFIRQNWSGFDLLEYLDDPSEFWQAFVVMRKSSAETSAPQD
jgi:ubiquinone/menaquinone biosynthesis C-methylase UbiE